MYSDQSANLYLLSSFNAELLQLMTQNISRQDIISQISDFYQLDQVEAQNLLDDLIEEYQRLGLFG